jgi:hypothetical protein
VHIEVTSDPKSVGIKGYAAERASRWLNYTDAPKPTLPLLWRFRGGIRGLSPLDPATITGTAAADVEAKSKSLSTPQTLEKREIPNNDAANII